MSNQGRLSDKDFESKLQRVPAVSLTPEDQAALTKYMADMQPVSEVTPTVSQPEQQTGISSPTIPGLRTAQDLLAGVVRAGEGITNAPYEIARSLKGMGAPISEQVISALPRQTADPSSIAFINTPLTTYDKIVQTVGQSAPFLFTPAGLASEMATGSLYGLTQSGDRPFTGALLGAALPPALRGATKIAPSFLLGTASKALAPYAVKPLLSELSQGIKNVLPETVNNEAYNIISTNYNSHRALENAAWNRVTNAAADFDRGTNIDFPNDTTTKISNKLDTNPFFSTLDEIRSKLTPGIGKDDDSLSYIRKYSNPDLSDSMSKAIELRKQVNADIASEREPITLRTLSQIGKSLDETIDNTIQKSGATTLGEHLDNARGLTRDKHSIFLETSTPSQRQRSTIFSNLMHVPNEYKNPAAVINDFIGKGGTEKYDQLADMMGAGAPNATEEQQALAKSNAIDTIKTNLFSDAFNTDGTIDGGKFVKSFKSLTNAQRKYLFNKDELKNANDLLTIAEKTPSAVRSQIASGSLGLVGMHMLHDTPGAFVGAIAGLPFGHPFLGGMLGAAATQVARPIIGKAVESSPSLQGAILSRLTGVPREVNKLDSNALSKYLSLTSKMKLGRISRLALTSGLMGATND